MKTFFGAAFSLALAIANTAFFIKLYILIADMVVECDGFANWCLDW
jgi:hypothetical protein